MTLDLQPYNENENTTLDLQPLNFENTKRFQGSISATPEYNAFDKIGTMLKNIADIPMHAIKQGSANVRTGELNFKLMNGDLDELEQSELNELENRATYNYGARQHAGLFDDSAFTDVNISNFGERFKNTALSTIGQSTESYPFMAEIMKSGGVGGIAGGIIFGITGGVVNTAKSGFAGTLSGFKNGALLGAKVLGGAGSAKKAIELEAGLAYQELKNMKDDEGNLIDPELAKRLALSVGIANASLEMTGAIAELSTFPMADKLLKSAKIEAIKNIIKDKTLSNKLLSAGSKALAKHYAMDGLETAVEKATKENINKLAKATITEMTTEGLQELSNVVATEWAKQIEGNYSDAIFSESGINSNAFKENMARIVQAGAMAFVPAFTIGGIGTTATAVNIARKKAQVEGLNPDEAERIVRNLTLEQQSEIINNNEETLEELADEQFSEEKFVEIQDQSFNKMINAGMSEAEAFSTAKVVAEMAKSFNNVEVATNWADNLTFVSDKALQGQVEMNINTADVPEVMFQESAQYAGVDFDENVNDIEKNAILQDAQREWNIKGTNSSYFKKWFGESKVVDEEGKPLVVYHGTENGSFEVFSEQKIEDGFFFTDDINTAKEYAEVAPFLAEDMTEEEIADSSKIYQVYLKLENPYIADMNGEEYSGTAIQGYIDEAKELGHDGLIIKNIVDKRYTDSEGSLGTDYIVFNSEQIKSVNNRGTFDAENPNIYYQNDYNEEKKNLVADKYKDQIKFYNGEWINRKLIEEKGIDFDKVEIGDYIDFFEESKRKQRPEYNPEIDKIAKEYFGTTNVINEAGYILRDGSKLDFSGKKDGGTPNRRNYDHREIVDAFIENEQYEDIGFNEFIDNGAIRFMPESKSMLIARKPSDEQLEALENIIALYQGEVTLELVNRMDEWGWDNNFRKSYDRFSNPKKILADIRVYFNGGKISEHKRYYQSAYHGTPHKFDNFSLEHIGSGEGNQAHGWGLYFAENKDVSEGYRKRLVPLDTSIEYKGKSPKYIEFKTGTNNITLLEAIIYSGKERTLRILSNNMPFGEDTNELIEYVKSIDEKELKAVKLGQLYEVDIPENDVLLDEQKTFTEQPKLIQESINKIFEEKKPSDIISEKIKWFDSMLNELEQKAIKDGGYTTQTNYSRNLYEEKISDLEKLLEKLNNYSELKGKDIYKILSIVYEGDKEASLLLNEYGIKGITYDGQQDGRCYVIFDDKAIDVIQTYYQENKAYNSFKEIENEFKEYIEIAPKDYEINNLEDALKDFGITKNKPLNVNTPIGNVEIREDRFEHIFNGGGDGHLPDKKRYKSINKMILTLKDPTIIVKDATGKKFHIKLFKKDNSAKNQVAIVYNDKNGDFVYTSMPVDKDKKYLLNRINNSTVIYKKGQTRVAKSNSAANNIITDNSDNFNPESDNFSRPKTLEEIHEDVRQRAKGMQYLGYFTQYQGKDIIGIMENANASTVLHELAHSYLNSLRTLALTDADMNVKYEAVKKWLGVVGNNEPTVAQHEKFAEGFEAYIYSGQAPNKNLQSIFIQFKNWLKQIHDYWLNREDFQMPSDVKEVFDTIFENNPKVISKRRKVQKYLDKALSIKVSDTLPLLDSEKRHKDFAYDIVSIATGYNVRYLKAILNTADGKSKDTQKEEIARRCAECDDRITNHGFNPEWTEFYSNASFYEGNDYLLAEQALSDIVNDNFNSNYTTVDYFNEFQAQYEYLINAYKNEILERDEILATVYKWLDHIGQKDYESFEIFLDKFEKDFNYISSFENASALEQAKLEILELAKNTKHLNLAGKFNKISENMDKISEKIKELNYTADATTTENQKTNSINIDKENVSTDVEAYREAVKEILNKLDFLTPNDKAKMFANIIDAPSATFLEARIEKVMDLANTLCEVQQRNELLDAITKELKSTENIKQNNKLVGKYNYRTNKLFTTLRSIMKMTAEEANDVRIERQEQISEAESEGMSFEDRIINLMLQVKSDGRTYANTALIKQLYDDICALKLVGKNAKSEEELFNKLNNKQNVDEVVSILEAKKEGNIFEKFYVNTVANWESMLNTFFSKVIKNKYSLIWNETKSSTWIHKEKTQFEKEVQKIYGLSKWNFDAEILKALSDEYEFNVRTYDKTIDEEGKTQWVLRRIVPMKMNRMQIILAYMWDKNEVLHERMVNMFGEETLIDMIDNLSEQDRRLGDLMMRTVNKYYPLANEQYIKKYGIDLPKVSAYFPSVTEREGSLSELDLFRDFTQKSTSPSFSKMRSESTHVEMKFGNPVAMLYHHIDTMGRFINMTEPLDRINKVFNNSDVKKLIKYKYGETALKEFMQQLVDISYKQNATVRSEQMRIVNAMVSNWTSANIIGKMTTGIKQLFACLNYSTVMPVNEWNVRFLKAISEPKKTIQYMYEKIDYLRYRFESGSQNEALKEWVENNQIEEWFYKKIDDFVKNENVLKMLKSSTITVPRKIKDVASLFLRCGDMGAIIFGGKPYIDYLIEVKGLTEEQAIQEFVVETQRTQQSAEISTLSNWQVASTQNPFSKLFMNYKNAQGQFLRKIADSLINYKRGDIDKTQLAKDLFMYGYFQSFLFKIATSLSILTLINTGDADDLLKDISTSIFDNLSFFHAFGDIGVGLINRFITGETTQFNSPLLSDIPREVLKVAKKDAEIKDFIHAIGFAVQLGKGIPVNAMVNSISGLGDIAQGEIQKGLLRALGNTENRANIATGQKKNKTKKITVVKDNPYIKRKGIRYDGK